MDAHRPVDIAKVDPELAFRKFVAFNKRPFRCRPSDKPRRRPWEMHPDTDELLFALQGSVTVELFGDGGNERVPLTAGALVVATRPVAPTRRRRRPRRAVPHSQSLGCDDPSTVSENDSR